MSKHVWIEYKSKHDIGNDQSFYCKNCGIITWKTSFTKGRFTVGAISYDKITCEEYIIKNIIE